MKKVLLVLPAGIEKSPYIQYYVELFSRNNIAYDIIYISSKGYICRRSFNGYEKIVYKPLLVKNIYVLKLCFFILSMMIACRYRFVIIFSIPLILFSFLFFKIRKENSYIYDIRDYSRILNYRLFRLLFVRAILDAPLVVLSSFGFKKWLPKREYVLSHNVSRFLIEKKVEGEKINSKIYTILTIGQIRDYDVNLLLMESLANDSLFMMQFAGYGKVYDLLKEQSKKLDIDNVDFLGSYLKENEGDIVAKVSFINAITSRNILSDNLLTNRLYLSCLYYKPIIVLSNTYQAELVRKYKLGIIVDDIIELKVKLMEYLQEYNYYDFKANCDVFRKDVFNDIVVFESQVMRLYEKN